MVDDWTVNIVLWVLSWIIAFWQFGNFIAGLLMARRARRPWLARLLSTVGLAVGVGLVVPWLVGEARWLTPVAGVLLLAILFNDTFTNRLPAADAPFIIAVMAMTVAVTVGRTATLLSGPTTWWSWLFAVGAIGAFTLVILGSVRNTPRTARVTELIGGVASLLAAIGIGS